jgi:hypothetical protein
MSSSAELTEVLYRVSELLDRHDTGTRWNDLDDLRFEIRAFLEKTAAGLPLSEAERQRLHLLFAPTGALQDAFIEGGLGKAFLELARRFDQAG